MEVRWWVKQYPCVKDQSPNTPYHCFPRQLFLGQTDFKTLKQMVVEL